MALAKCSECGETVSDKALLCPHCGAPTGRGGLVGYVYASGCEYRSPQTVLGMPLLHIATGIDPETGLKRVARGFIAIGDVAIGVIALGGMAFGGLAFGGLALGLVALGGVALGVLLALGGAALGSVALGGVALGYYAFGGLALGLRALGGDCPGH